MNKLILVSGHSGGGKTSLMRLLMNNEIISFTTRERRNGEIAGKDYNFISLNEFRTLKEKGKLIESVEYGGNHYGIDSEEFNDKIGKDHAFCIVDYHGMTQLKEFYPSCVTLFLYTPFEQAERQMISRGDSKDKVLKRLETYTEEMKNKQFYDYVVRNNSGQFENTRDIIKNIIESETNA